VSIADRKAYLHSILQQVHATDLTPREQQKLKRALVERLEVYPLETGTATLKDTMADLRARHPIVGEAIRRAAINASGIDPGTIVYDFDELSPEGDFAISLRKGTALPGDDLVRHRIIERGILDSSGLNHRIRFMDTFAAVSGFQEADAPLFNARLGILASRQDAAAEEARLTRVLQIGGMPSLRDAPRIDVDTLLRVRASDEMAEFRAWLNTTGEMSDEAIAGHFRSVRPRIAHLARSDTGRMLRFLAWSGVTLLNAPIGLAGSFIDAFFVDYVVGKPGPSAFIGQEYRAIFRSE
jgi:hypothetical protein